MTLYHWSQTASADATADSTINWQEGQAPSSVNDSARAMMAAIAKWRDDLGSNLQTSGTSTAYTIASNQVFDSLANMAAKEISFFVHATNGANATLNVDGLGAYPIVIDGVPTAVPSGTLIAGGIYTVVWSNSTTTFRLKDFYQIPYIVPIGGLMDFIGSSVPSSNFVFPTGQAISRSTYSTLFSLVGTTYGVGDGSTTFNIPNLQGRVTAMKDGTGLVLTSATMTPDGNTLGATGGAQSSTLSTTHLPPYTPTGTISNGSITINNQANLRNVAGDFNNGGGGGGAFGALSSVTPGLTASQATSTFSGSAQGGASTAFTNIQPTMAVNKILRVI